MYVPRTQEVTTSIGKIAFLWESLQSHELCPAGWGSAREWRAAGCRLHSQVEPAAPEKVQLPCRGKLGITVTHSAKLGYCFSVNNVSAVLTCPSLCQTIPGKFFMKSSPDHFYSNQTPGSSAILRNERTSFIYCFTI